MTISIITLHTVQNVINLFEMVHEIFRSIKISSFFSVSQIQTLLTLRCILWFVMRMLFFLCTRPPSFIPFSFCCLCCPLFCQWVCENFVETWLLHIIQWNRFDTNDLKKKNRERWRCTHMHQKRKEKEKLENNVFNTLLRNTAHIRRDACALSERIIGKRISGVTRKIERNKIMCEWKRIGRQSNLNTANWHVTENKCVLVSHKA